MVSSPVVQWSLLAFCALLYVPTRLLHEANPIWRLTSLLWTLEVIGITLLMLSLVLAAYNAPRTTHHTSGISAFSISAFVFPVCFFLVAVPWPSGLETFLTQSLMRLNVSATIDLLSVFGVPAIQHGNVIEIATGMVGIDDACSGIRSLQASLMLSLFFGEVYALTISRRILCVLAGFALAFTFNVGRTLFLTQIASAKGVGAVATWHDPAGVTILVACFLSLWLIALAFKPKSERSAPTSDLRPPTSDFASPSQVQGSRFEVQGSKFAPPPAASPITGGPVVPLSCSPVVPSTLDVPSAGVPVSRGLVVPLSLVIWLLLVEGGNYVWYHSHEHPSAAAIQWSLTPEKMGQGFTKIKIPPSISGQFRADEATHARWQDDAGNSWQFYYFRWLPAAALGKRIAIQLAKTHGPETCLPAAGMTLKSYHGIITVPVAGMELAMQQYVFNADGRPVHVFYGIYEDSSGSAVLANRRKNTRSRVAAALAGSRNYGQRFFEVAVSGYEQPEDARAALTRELPKLIKVEK